ncbi:predicted protein [Uncinocarpus reesii 1704]|uniref:Peptidase M12A domain-containing protein n=1 Tax=Uncinocarpus reesii (strain UAMH 1704) TaxID=336963 RepID=C4JUS2_UNCRE|nr:uncharacterized protein UREG_04875 [Uncinocarpus reesii 1704]EEP80033.1 predicted protein [Uncinocarpus reesii 1704]
MLLLGHRRKTEAATIQKQSPSHLFYYIDTRNGILSDGASSHWVVKSQRMRSGSKILYLFIYILAEILCVCEAASASINEPAEIMPRAGSWTRRRWRNGLMKYCFDVQNPAKRKELEEIFDDGWAVWAEHQGFPLRRQKLANCPDTVGERKDTLVVKLTDSSPTTTVGNNGEAEMKFNVDFKGADKNIVHTMVHELGHAFGLIHEHQKPGAEKHITFKCENLADYDTIKKKYPGSINSLCRNLNGAVSAEFTASNFIPYNGDYRSGVVLEHGANIDAADYIDWRSIMIYGSDFGAKRGLMGLKKKVITKTDGSEIKPNGDPSARDVAFLIWWYSQPDEDDMDLPFLTGGG